MDGLAFYALCYLAAAVIAVIVSQRVGLGSVVGYIAAGVLVGPVFQVAVAGSNYLEQFSEFGIVMMLFLIGLEIDPQMVWRLKGKLLGLGGLQVLATVGASVAVAIVLGFSWQQGLLFGFVAALSSTAIVLQTLEEKGLIKSDGGQASFAVLLFQDLAVIPMLACIPLIAGGGHGVSAGHGSTLMENLPGWASAILTLGAIGLVVAAAHYLSRPIFRTIALLGLREVFTAAALLVVVGIAVLMSAVGLSPALGAFLGGVVLANSEFKHELQNDIEPFKGLLLGLFFMTIGARIDPAIFLANWPAVVAATLGLIVLKASVLVPLAWFFRLRGAAGWLFALGLAQAGEFGFVLLSIGGDRGILSSETVSVCVLVVTFGMVLTPVLFKLYDRITLALESHGRRGNISDEPEEGTIILAGVGRFGQIVNRMLLANGYRPVVLDYRADVVENVRKFGVKSFFGDAGRPDLLESAGISRAALLVVAIDDPDRATEIVNHARRSNPNIRIIARAYDRLHHYALLEAGADHIVRELFEGSLQAAGLALQSLGVHPYEVEKRKAVFVEQDLAGLERMASLVDEDVPVVNNPEFIAGFNDIGKVIQDAMMGYRAGYDDIVSRGWNAPDASSIHVPKSSET
ncbi:MULTISPECIES: cation:proton antiporter domain-containing protein [unclassified Rhizobium]|uniref:cation:proton antiporter domain-containing protein n=1 Tax=unclassified Rhizobium TaxID=2613769 RepID=UPI001ADB0E05|nr:MULTISPECIES: cation:proton antiporter [unclassified Rhizobium]MBO9127771.1 cation:proton antiporter [Rhizobium sp. 16-488-2b]MBO9178233.1 cation:proton antiporter [Rhizobium sp. 16-488-2a]